MSPVWYHQFAAGGDGRLRAAPVALEHRVGSLRSHDDLALGAAGDLVVVVVEDPDVEVLVVDDAGRVRLVLDARRLPRDQRRLGDAVGAAERLDPEAVTDEPVDLDRQGRGADEPQGRVGLGGARAWHLRPVDVVGEQVRHRAERRRDGGADPVHLRPEAGDGEAALDGGPPAVDERPEHGGDDGVEVEQRQRRPHDVVGVRCASRRRSGGTRAAW